MEAFTFSFYLGECGDNFLLLDLHGVSYLLCDPEIATVDLRVKDGSTKSYFYFCLGTCQQIQYMNLC